MAIYNGKHVVFEQVGVDSDFVVWNVDTNADSDGVINNWNISNMRNTVLPARLLLLSNDLQGVITNTTIQTATNGINGTLVNTNDKLFLAAEKEMNQTGVWSRTEESSALTTWAYWTTHTTANDRKKYDPNNTAEAYWLRSPYSGRTYEVVLVGNNGSFFGDYVANSYQVSLCYAF